MPTLVQLSELTSQIYERKVFGSSGKEIYSKFNPNSVVFKALGVPPDFELWSSEEIDSDEAYIRLFMSYNNMSTVTYFSRFADRRFAVCLVD